jgi:hypothetical protein
METFKYFAVMVLGFVAVLLYFAVPFIAAVVIEHSTSIRFDSDSFKDFWFFCWVAQFLICVGIVDYAYNARNRA